MKTNFHRKRHLFILLPVFLLALTLSAGGRASAAGTKTITLDVKKGSDIAKELQKALDQARYSEDQTLYKIKIPAGAYKLGRQLKFYSNTYLSMKGVTLKRDFSSSADRKKHSMMRLMRLSSEWNQDGGYQGYSGAKNITFDGGTWDCASADGAQIVRIAHARDITFKDVTFKNVKSSHHIELAACRDVVFSRCTFTGFSGKWNTSTNYEALQFDIMREEHFSAYPAYDETPCRDITVDRCTFSNLQRGVGSHSAVAGSYFQNIKITNCKFSKIKGYAITAVNYLNAQISGNKISNCGSGICFYAMMPARRNVYAPLHSKLKLRSNLKSTIKNNTISVTDRGYQSVNFGISLYGDKLKKTVSVKDSSGKYKIPKGNYTVGGVTVKDNKITLNSNGYAIWMRGASNNKITKNSIVCGKKSGKKGNGDGIRLQGCSRNQITGNTIKTAARDGISVDSSTGISIKKNRISKSGRYGIYAANKSKVTSSGNTVSGSKRKKTSCSGGAKINGKTS